jgi:hypothetical protein
LQISRDTFRGSSADLFALKKSIAKFLLTRRINTESLVKIVFGASVLGLDLVKRHDVRFVKHEIPPRMQPVLRSAEFLVIGIGRGHDQLLGRGV